MNCGKNALKKWSLDIESTCAMNGEDLGITDHFFKGKKGALQKGHHFRKWCSNLGDCFRYPFSLSAGFGTGWGISRNCGG